MVEGLGQEGGGRLSGHVKDNSASSLENFALDGAASVLEIEINKSLKFTSSLLPGFVRAQKARRAPVSGRCESLVILLCGTDTWP